ncbi:MULTISPECIES: isochorismatase family protein [unclassified Caballeronia]|uniref:isochorismatase family protein n=1 Tax=unclassified Caballeronia TaxID=2646786 RepID=UPI0028551E51|nr:MULTISPECIES: isochorismatase family protein [unclassified Caballeronia]MDR5751529.1 isochorismatase family protein [Caballeronia sp. LZ024]MDR5844331.1 isochorismatase family protein [Caballeronia sp. LZ031]
MPRRALIVIDVQNEYITGNLPIEYPDVNVSLANIGRAIDAAHVHRVPVVVVRQVAPATSPLFAHDSHGAELHEVVASRPHAHQIDKALPSAFAGTDLAHWLTEHEIDTLVIAGYMTHNCDDSTVKHAVHAGLSVEFLCDATGAVPYENRAGRASAEEIHRVFTVVMQSRFAAVLTTAEWIAALGTGEAPARDSIYASNQQARSGRAAG